MKRMVNGNEVELTNCDCKVYDHGDRYLVVSDAGFGSAAVVRDRNDILVSYRGKQYRIQPPATRIAQRVQSSGKLLAPMPGQIVDIRVAVGDKVVAAQTLLILEAMKTHQPILAPHNGVVKELKAKIGIQVSEGDSLVWVQEATVE